MKGKRERFTVTFTIEVLLMMGLIVLTGCKNKVEPTTPAETKQKASGANKGDDMGKVLKITWQRLVDEKGRTCQRCGSTEKELQKALRSLKKSFAPLGIKVISEKKALDPATCAKDISQSNRIWIGERTLEEWLGAKVGKSTCGFCCAELGDQVECRTVEIEGQVYETIPANLIIRAGLLAAASLYEGPPANPCCPGSSPAKTTVLPCCPVSSEKDQGEGNRSCIKSNLKQHKLNEIQDENRQLKKRY